MLTREAFVKRRKVARARLVRNVGSAEGSGVQPKSGGFDAPQLAAEVRRRFHPPAGGGRATDPGWTAKRLIPMRPDTLARLEELAKEVSRRAKRRVESLQLAALIIESHLAPRRAQGARESLRGFAKYRGKVAWEGSLDDLRQRRLDPGARCGPVSGLDLVRDLAGSVSGPPDLSTRILEPVRASRITSKKQKRSGRRPGSQHTSRSARPFPDRSTFRRSMPLLDPPLSASVIQGRKGRT